MSQTCTPSRQSTIAARYLDATAFQKDDVEAFMSSSTRELPSNKSLNESTFTASTILLDSSTGSWKSNGSSGSRSRSPDRASTSNNSVQSLERSIDFLLSTPLTPGRDSVAPGSSDAPSRSTSPMTPSRRNLLQRFRRRRQQASIVKSRVEGDRCYVESTPERFSKQQAQHEQLARPYQLQKTSTLNQPILPDPSVVQIYSQPITNGTSQKSNERILNSRIALRARSKGLRLFPKTTPEQQPLATKTQPRHQQMPSPNQQDSAPTEIMTEVMQNLSSARDLKSTKANLSEAGAPTEIMTNQTRKAHRAAISHQEPEPMLHRSAPQHALLHGATTTLDQQSLPITSLLDLQQSSSLSTTNSLDSSRKVLHILQQQQRQQNAESSREQKSPLAQPMVRERSLDAHFSQERGSHHSLNLKYSDDASSCYTQDRSMRNDDMVQRVFSNDRMDLAHEIPIHPPLTDSGKHLRYAFPQINSRHPSEVSLSVKAAPDILNGMREENSTNNAEGVSFASKVVRPPSNLQLEDIVPHKVHPLSISKSVSLEGLAFAYSKEEEEAHEDEQDSANSYISTAVNPPSAASAAGSTRVDNFDVYDDSDNLKSLPSQPVGFELIEANPAFVSANENHLGLQRDVLEESSKAQSASFSCTKTNLPFVRSNDEDESGQEATVLLSTPHSRLNSIVNFGSDANDKRVSLVKKLSFPPSQYKQGGLEEVPVLNDGCKQYEKKEIEQAMDIMKRHGEQSSRLDDNIKIQNVEKELLPGTNIASSHSHEVQKVNKSSNLYERRSFGSIKDRMKAFDTPKEIGNQTVKDKTGKWPRKKTGHVALLNQDSVQPVVVVFPHDALEEKKSENAPLSYFRDDNEDTASIKSLAELWEKNCDNYNMDLDNDTIKDIIICDDDDDSASVKNLRDKWEIKFSKVDLEQGIETDLEDDVGEVQKRREELQKRIWGQQGLPRVVSVDQNENDDLNLDDNQSVKCLRKRYDVPKVPKQESVSRLRLMFEPSRPAPTCSPSWNGKKISSPSAARGSRSWNHSTMKCHSQVNHGDELKNDELAMTWNKKLSNGNCKKLADDIVPSESIVQDSLAANRDIYGGANGREDANVDDSCLQGRQTEMKEVRTLMDVATSEKSAGSIPSYPERSTVVPANNVPYAAPKEVRNERRRAPSMQDRLDCWSTRLRAAKESPVCAQDDFSRDSLALDTSLSGYDDVNHHQRYFEDCSETLYMSNSSMSDVPIGDAPKVTPEIDLRISPRSRGDSMGRSMSTDYSDAVTLDVSIASISNITDPSYLRSMGSRDSLRDVHSSPRRLASPCRMTVETEPATLKSKPRRSTLSSMPEATSDKFLEESDLRPKVPKDTPAFLQDSEAKIFLSIPEQEHHPEMEKSFIKLNDDPLPSYDGDFVIDEERFKKQAASIPYYNMNTGQSVDISPSSVSDSSPGTFTSTKVETKLCMVPAIPHPIARINDQADGSGGESVSEEINGNTSIHQPSPADFDQQQHTQPPKKQAKMVSFKLMDEHSVNSSEDSRVTEQTLPSSERSSLPSMPSMADKNYDAIMHKRHQILMKRQLAHKEKLATRQGLNLSLGQHLVLPLESTNNSGKSEPVFLRRSSAQEPVQSRTQMKFFGRTHPNQPSAQCAATNNKVVLRSLLRKKAQQQRSALTTTRTPVTPSRNLQKPSQSPSKATSRSLFSKPTAALLPSKAESRSLFSKKMQPQAIAQTLVTPPSNAEENPGLGTSPQHSENHFKSAIPRYDLGRKPMTLLYNKMATTFGFGEPESAKDIVARLQSYQLAHQQPVKNKHAYDSGLETDEWL